MNWNVTDTFSTMLKWFAAMNSSQKFTAIRQAREKLISPGKLTARKYQRVKGQTSSYF